MSGLFELMETTLQKTIASSLRGKVEITQFYPIEARYSGEQACQNNHREKAFSFEHANLIFDLRDGRRCNVGFALRYVIPPKGDPIMKGLLLSDRAVSDGREFQKAIFCYLGDELVDASDIDLSQDFPAKGFDDKEKGMCSK